MAIVLLSPYFIVSFTQAQSALEDFRPRYHFTPEKNWINDPCGMVYLNGEYHLMYQYNPYGTQWGNMSWGHAISEDMVHWEELPVALTPDNLGDIFSGGAIIDKENTAGFGEHAMIAINTSAGNQQQQSIAYSLDQGRSWTKYANNPVLPNQGTPDFRDPMVFWHEQTSKWIMALAVSNRIEFYGSPNLKEWTYLSAFGQNIGAHGGVWECPDMFVRKDQFGNEYWVLLVSINPGGPQGGSATQYFVGDFDGQVFSLHSSIQELLTKEVALPAGVVFEDFENEDYSGWTASGEAFGIGPASGALDGQQEVAGFLGQGLVNSFLNGDVTTGLLTSSQFTVDKDYISFLIGGGNHPDKTGISLMVDGQSALSATGQNTEELSWNSWDVTQWKGKQATLEIIDMHSEGWGHINIDHIYFSNDPVIDDRIEALWADWGTDNYAGRSFENAPENDDRRIWMGWMSNWSYAGDLPTSTWRGAMTIPRTLEVLTRDGIPRLKQEPIEEMKSLRGENLLGLSDVSFVDFENEVKGLNLSGQSYEMQLEIAVDTGDEFELSFLKRQSLSSILRYNSDKELLTFDRRSSGFTNFNQSFPGIYELSVSPVEGVIKLHLFVDRSSIEIFVNDGVEVFTFRVFPVDQSDLLSARVTNGAPGIVQASLWELQGISHNPILTTSQSELLPMNISPNPVSLGEHFKLHGVQGNINAIQLYDMGGRQISSSKINFDGDAIAIQGIGSGLYVLIGSTLNNRYKAKIIIK